MDIRFALNNYAKIRAILSWEFYEISEEFRIYLPRFLEVNILKLVGLTNSDFPKEITIT